MSLAILEFEEQFGRLWHRLVGGWTSWPGFPEAAVTLATERARLAVLFRGMGGTAGLELAAGTARSSRHRLGLAQRLGMSEERLPLAERTDQTVLLPPLLDCLPTVELNRDLYGWLTAFLAFAEEAGELPSDPLRRDVLQLRLAARTTRRVLAAFPGLRDRHARLAAALLEHRPPRRLAGIEAEVEAALRALHGARETPGPIAALLAEPHRPLDGLRAPRGYRPFLPSPLWGEVRAGALSPSAEAGHEDHDRTGKVGDDDPILHRRARRREEGARRSDPLTLVNKGEWLLLPTEAVDVNRPDDEEDPEAARKVAQDMEEITLGRPDRRAASRLRMSLDLPAATPAADRATGRFVYPEWDYRRRAYLPDHCAVTTRTAPEDGVGWQPNAMLRRQIRLVRRRFEVIRPRREVLRAQIDGSELDTDALVRARADLRADGIASDRIYLDRRNQARDLAIAILMDSSLSTDGWVEGQRVLDVEKAAVMAFAHGLEACGDPFAILTFSSRRHSATSVETVKDFLEPLGEPVRRRLTGVQPGAYTRIGTALRHTAARLHERGERHRLLLLLSDGKPNDLDHYEGRYGIEDTRKAVTEARAGGLAVFAVTVDRQAETYVPYIFGRGGYAIVSQLGRLPDALPAVYRQLVA